MANDGDKEDSCSRKYWSQHPLYEDFENGNFLPVQAILEFHFRPKIGFSDRTLQLIAEECKGDFKSVTFRYEQVAEGLTRPAVYFQAGLLMVVLTPDSLRVVYGGCVGRMFDFGPSVAAISSVRKMIKKYGHRSKAKWHGSFSANTVERTACKLTFFAKADLPKFKFFDRRSIFNPNWLSQFSGAEDKLYKLEFNLGPDAKDEIPSKFDTSISIRVAPSGEFDTELAENAKATLSFGPVVEFAVTRGYLKETSYNYGRLDDTYEFAKDNLLNLFSEENLWAV